MTEKYIQFLPLLAKIQELAVLAPEGMHVFYDWSPHVNGVFVSIFINGWEDGRTPDARGHAYLNYPDAELKLEGLINLISDSILKRLTQ